MDSHSGSVSLCVRNSETLPPDFQKNAWEVCMSPSHVVRYKLVWFRGRKEGREGGGYLSLSWVLWNNTMQAAYASGVIAVVLKSHPSRVRVVFYPVGYSRCRDTVILLTKVSKYAIQSSRKYISNSGTWIHFNKAICWCKDLGAAQHPWRRGTCGPLLSEHDIMKQPRLKSDPGLSWENIKSNISQTASACTWEHLFISSPREDLTLSGKPLSSRGPQGIFPLGVSYVLKWFGKSEQVLAVDNWRYSK